MPTISSPPRFVHVLLCDNDFGQVLESATRQVFESTKAACDAEVFKDCVVHLTSALDRLRDASHGRKCDDASLTYLQNQVRVEYSNTAPNLDHDGGSVAVDVSTGYVWRF